MQKNFNSHVDPSVNIELHVPSFITGNRCRLVHSRRCQIKGHIDNFQNSINNSKMLQYFVPMLM